MHITKTLCLLIFTLLLTPFIVSADATVLQQNILQARAQVDAWQPQTAYAVDDVVAYNGILYRTLQAHTSQSDWTPDTVPALFTRHFFYELGEVPPFIQPTGAHDSYQIGHSIHYEGSVYTSTINANVWSPSAYPQGWEYIGDHLPMNTHDGTVLLDDNMIYTAFAGISSVYTDTVGYFNASLPRTVAVADYTPDNYTVVMYVGTHDVPYAIYSHPDIYADRITARLNGTHLFDVVSVDGFITYNTSGFSLQIASIADVILGFNDMDTRTFGDFFSGMTVTQLYIIGSPYCGSHPDCNQWNQIILENNLEFADIDGVLDTQFFAGAVIADDFVRWDSYTTEITQLMCMDVNDGVTFDGDCFNVKVEDQSTSPVSQIASFPNRNLGTNGIIVMNMNSYFADYTSINVVFSDPIASTSVSITCTLATGSGCAFHDGGVLVDVDSITSTIFVGIESKGEDFSETVTITAYGVDDSEESDTFTVTTSETTPPSSDLLDGLQAYYKLDEVSGTTASDSHGNNDGTANHAQVFTTEVSGIINTGADFTQANDYISITTSSNPFSITDSLTFSAWFNLDSVSGTQYLFFDRERVSGSQTNHGWGIGIYSGDLYIAFGDGSTSSNQVLAIPSLNTSQWYHLVVIKDGADRKVYLNNRLEYDNTGFAGSIDFDAPSAQQRTVIGGRNVDVANTLNGIVDEIGIWNSVLSVELVEELYNDGNGLSYDNFDVAGELPTLINPIANITLNYNQSTTFFISDYFEDYTASQVYINGTDSDNQPFNITWETPVAGNDNASILFPVSAFTQLINIVSTFNSGVDWYTVSVCNDAGCVDSTFTVTTQATAPQVWELIPPQILDVNSESTIFFWNYFTGIAPQLVSPLSATGSYMRLSWIDPITEDPVQINTTDLTDPDTYSYVVVDGNAFLYYSIEVAWFGGSLPQSTPLWQGMGIRFTSEINTVEPFVITVEVCNDNDDNCAVQPMTFGVQGATEPPQQLASIVDRVLSFNDNDSINLNTFFTSFQTATVTFTDPFSNTQQQISSGQSYDTSGIGMSLLFNVLTIQAKEVELLFSPVTIEVCNSIGCTNTSFNLVITETGITQIDTPETLTLPYAQQGFRAVNNYFIFYDYYYARVFDPVTNQPYNLHPSEGTRTFNGMTVTVANNRITVTSHQQNIDTNIQMVVGTWLNDQQGAFNPASELLAPFRVVVTQTGTIPTDPADIEDIDEWVSLNAPFIVGVIIVLSLAGMGALVSGGNPIVTLLSAFFGLMISAYWGLIGIGWVILTVLLMVALAFVERLLTRGSRGD